MGFSIHVPELMRFQRYNDTPDEDWIISRHPEDPSIILATGGSGHAFKVFHGFIIRIKTVYEIEVSSCQSSDGLSLVS